MLIATLYIANTYISSAYLDIDWETVTEADLEDIKMPITSAVFLLATPFLAAVAAIHMAVGKMKIASGGKFRAKVWIIMIITYILDAFLFSGFDFITPLLYIPAVFYVSNRISKSIIPIASETQAAAPTGAVPTTSSVVLPTFSPFNQMGIRAGLDAVDSSLDFMFAHSNASIGTYAVAGSLTALTLTYYILAWNARDIYIFELSKFSNSKAVNQSIIPWDSVTGVSRKKGWFVDKLKIEATSGAIHIDVNRKAYGLGNQTNAVERFLQVKA